MKLLKQYLDTEKQIYDYFGHNSEADFGVGVGNDNRIFIKDMARAYWALKSDHFGEHVVYKHNNAHFNKQEDYSFDEFNREQIYNDYYVGLKNSLLRKEDFTAIIVYSDLDDRNLIFIIFDNTKEIK